MYLEDATLYRGVLQFKGQKFRNKANREKMLSNLPSEAVIYLRKLMFVD